MVMLIPILEHLHKQKLNEKTTPIQVFNHGLA